MQSQMSDASSVSQRLDKLEKQNRRLKMALTLFTILAGCLVFVGARFRGGRTITARRIVLKADSGATRAILGMRSAGPGLVLYDENGENIEALLAVLQTGPVLSLYDRNGATRALLGVTPKGATLALNDQHGKLRVEIGFSSNEPNVTFFDPNGKPTYRAH